jgi:hypothetical protein
MMSFSTSKHFHFSPYSSAYFPKLSVLEYDINTASCSSICNRNPVSQYLSLTIDNRGKNNLEGMFLPTLVKAAAGLASGIYLFKPSRLTSCRVRLAY